MLYSLKDLFQRSHLMLIVVVIAGLLGGACADVGSTDDGGSVEAAIEEMMVGRWWLDWDSVTGDGIKLFPGAIGLPTFTADGWANYDVTFPVGVPYAPMDWCRRYANWALFDVVSETEFGYELTYTGDTCNRSVGSTERFEVVLDQTDPPKGEVTRIEPGDAYAMPFGHCTTDINASLACTFDTGLDTPVESRAPVTMFISTVEVIEDETTPLEGVEICQLDTDNCVTSNASGRAELELPADREVAWTIEKEGYGSFLTHDVTDHTFSAVSTEPMHTHEQLADYAAQLGISYPWTGGIVGLNTAPGMAGLTFDLLGESATPFYSDETGVYSYDLEQTTGVGGFPAPLGMGGFAQLTPGEYAVHFHGTDDRCPELSFGWLGGERNRMRIPVREGYISYGSLRCDAP